MTRTHAVFAQTNLDVFVPGIPRGAGSKRGFAFRRRNGALGVAMSDDTGELGKAWRAALSSIVADEWGDRALLDGALRLDLEFTMPRPRSHFGRRRGVEYLRDNAPLFHTAKPDVTKLVRAVEDSLSGVVWRDDCLIAAQSATKRYGDRPGVEIVISALAGESEVTSCATAAAESRISEIGGPNATH